MSFIPVPVGLGARAATARYPTPPTAPNLLHCKQPERTEEEELPRAANDPVLLIALVK